MARFGMLVEVQDRHILHTLNIVDIAPLLQIGILARRQH
jgi:hypothetical protein